MAQKTETPPVEAAAMSSTDWLNPLEEKIHAAAERIQALKQENASLHQRIEDLEARLASASPDDGASRWEEERREIRERVERLTKTLEDVAGL